jgi:hypothetical protein
MAAAALLVAVVRQHMLHYCRNHQVLYAVGYV